jgi:SAM-dependent methyltransferase
LKALHLPLLCDPYTREPLELEIFAAEGDEILTGKLKSKTNSFDIRNGIPRFVGRQNYSDSFGFQWNRWSSVQLERENKGTAMEGVTLKKFLAFSRFHKEKIHNKVVLDLGCGAGRFADIALTFGATVIAIDYSSAIDAARHNLRDYSNVLLIQGDALMLPLIENSVDYAFSVGVLHHTPAPGVAVDNVYRVLRTGGEFALRVYSESGFYRSRQITFWRTLFKGLRPVFRFYPPLVYAYVASTVGFYAKRYGLISKVLQFFFPINVWLPSLRWTILDTFDAVSPTFQSGHTPEEMLDWLRKSGFASINYIGGRDVISIK